MTNPKTAAPGAAVDRLMALARDMSLAEVDAHFLCPNEGEAGSPEYIAADAKYVKARDALREALRAALLAGVAGGQTEELQLIEAVLRGYPESMARADALRAVRKLLAHPPVPVRAPQGADALPEPFGTICDDGHWLVNHKGPHGHNHVNAGWPSKKVYTEEQVRQLLAASHEVTGALPADLSALARTAGAAMFEKSGAYGNYEANSVLFSPAEWKKFCALAATPPSAAPAEPTLSEMLTVEVPLVPTQPMIEAAFRVRATMFHESEDEKNIAAYSAMVAARSQS